MPSKKIAYFYFQRFIEAVPIMGPEYLQLESFFKVSIHKMLSNGLSMHLGFQKVSKRCNFSFLAILFS